MSTRIDLRAWGSEVPPVPLLVLFGARGSFLDGTQNIAFGKAVKLAIHIGVTPSKHPGPHDPGHWLPQDLFLLLDVVGHLRGYAPPRITQLKRGDILVGAEVPGGVLAA